MIVDCFIFNNEWDILEIRFEELYPVVDKFIIVEANQTLSGNDKPFHFLEQGERRFPQYLDKVSVCGTAIPREITSAWVREQFQRDIIMNGIRYLAPDDTVIISDADEIPRRSAVQQLAGTGPVALCLDKFMYYLNTKTSEVHGSTKMIPRWMLDDNTPHNLRKTLFDNHFMQAGWEFSSFGTPEQVQEKMQSFAHTEYNTPQYASLEGIRHRMENLIDIIDRPDQLQVMEIDDTWPEAVKNNPERWKEHVWSA